jgi:hypothetical protein
MFRVLRAGHPDLTYRLWTELSQHYFRAVILDGAPWLASHGTVDGDFGPGFIQQLQTYYQPVGSFGEFWVYLPKK